MSEKNLYDNKLFIAAVALTFGILAAILIRPGYVIVFAAMLFLCLLFFINRHNKKVVMLSFVFCIVFIGMLEYRFFINMPSKLVNFNDRQAVYECIIIDEPRIVDVFHKKTPRNSENFRDSYTEYKLKTRAIKDNGKTYNFSEKLLLKSKNNTLRFGDIVEVHGAISSIAGKRNPGDFDFTLYYKSKGYNYFIKSDAVAKLESNAGNLFSALLHNSKLKVKAAIFKVLPEEEASILYGILTGDRSGMEEEVKELYARAGLAHILSVSGLHIGFLVLLAGFILKPFMLDKKLESIITIIVVLYYILMIGAPLPALRAFIMFLVLVGGKLLNRKYDLLSSIAFAHIILLVCNPLSIHDPGFVISFACMYSIAILYEPMYKALKFLPLYIRSPLVLSIAVNIGIVPVLIYYFNYISLIGILLNLIAIPISFIITIVGFLGVAVGMLSQYISVFFFSVDFYSLKLLYIITERAVNLPFAGFYIPALPVCFYLVYYAVVIHFTGWFGSVYFKVYKRKAVIILVSTAAIAFMLYFIPSKDMKLVFFDVGQGDSSCIITPSKKVILIDGGGSTKTPDYYYDVGKKVTVPALLHQGIWNLDTIIVSHIHEDHMEGLLSVLKVYNAKRLILPKIDYIPDTETYPENYIKLLEICKRKRIPVNYLEEGDIVQLGSKIKLQVLSPGEKLIQGSDADVNNNSLVLRLTYGSFSALYTGDIQSEAEAKLLEKNLDSDILKVAHHGSGFSSADKFLSMVSPRLSIISVGKNNYGHPSEEAVERLINTGSKIFRTDEDGAVVVITDGNTMKYTSIKN